MEQKKKEIIEGITIIALFIMFIVTMIVIFNMETKYNECVVELNNCSDNCLNYNYEAGLFVTNEPIENQFIYKGVEENE